jgi:hypothetical protein
MPDELPVAAELLEKGLTTVAAVLSHHSVKYAVIGGMAAGFHSQPRFTKDLDFLLQIPQLQLPRVLEDLSGKGFEFDELATIRAWTQDHMTVLFFHGMRIDWLKPMLPVYQHVLERATVVDWLSRPIRVATTEGLILLKLLADRTQDHLDIENLVAFHRDRLDLDWIKAEWQAIAPESDPRMQRLLALVASGK